MAFISQGKATTKKIFKSCLKKHKTVLIIEKFDFMFLFDIFC